MRKRKLTPEELEAQRIQKANDLKRQQEIAAQREAKAQQEHEDCLAWIRGAADMSRETPNGMVISECAQCYLDAQDAIDAFAVKVRLNAHWAFGWSGGEMVAACEQMESANILNAVKTAGNMDCIKAAVEYQRQEIIRRMTGNFDAPSSTSAAQNALSIYKAEARSRFLRRLERWISALRTQEILPEKGL